MLSIISSFIFQVGASIQELRN